jgi:hypothetical protein
MDYLDRTDEAPQEMVTFSPRDAYYKARLERGDEGADTGAEIRLAIKAMLFVMVSALILVGHIGLVSGTRNHLL